MSERNELARARQLIADEMETAHAAIVRLKLWSDQTGFGDTIRTNWQVMARLMSAQVGAANALQRLSPARDRFAFTYIHQGSPSRRNLKTNGPPPAVLEGNAVEKIGDATAKV